MAISQEFRDAVEGKKTVRVRIMLKDSLLVDPTLVQFHELEQFAASYIGDLYVEHDGAPLNFDVSAWNESYLNEQMVAVIGNFSKERMDLLKSMVRQLYKEKADKIRDEREVKPTSPAISRKQAGAGITVAGAAIAVAGVCTSHGILIAGGVAVAAAGVVVIVSDKKGNS